MATPSVFITGTAHGSGKSVVALGLMELLSARTGNVGFFRPIIPSGASSDPETLLMLDRYGIDVAPADAHALSVEEADALVARGQLDALEKAVIGAYRAIEQRFDFVVVEGTDFSGATPAHDFDLNTGLANQLGAPVLAVVRAASAADAPDAVRITREALARKRCAIAGVIVNRVPPDDVAGVTAALASADGADPVYVLTEHPELAHPTVADVAEAIGARVVIDERSTLQREVRAVRIGAMAVEHYIDDIVDGTLVIVPGDRPDIVVASYATSLAAGFPSIAGVLLTAGYPLDSGVRRLLADAPFPLLETPARTYAAATAVDAVRPSLASADERKIATALGVFEAGVDTAELERRMAIERPRRVTPAMFEYDLIERAKADGRRIVLPEGDDERVLRAAEILLRRGVAAITVLGPPDQVLGQAAALGLNLDGADVVDPAESPLRANYATRYHEARKHKGVTPELAFETLADPTYFGTMMVHAGAVDGMVSGAAHTTGDTIRPAFEFVRARPGVVVVSSVFFMCLADRVLVYGDCAVNPRPNVEQLADIAATSADTASRFGIEPRIAMLSYSTGESGAGAGVDAVRAATALVRERRPDLPVDGPIQYDAAVDPEVARLKLPDSDVAGRATVLIFPDLDTGNVAYKAVQRSSGAVAVGPVLQGLNRPVNDLSRGCSVTDIVTTVAITAIQAQSDSAPRDSSRTMSVVRAQLLTARPAAGAATP